MFIAYAPGMMSPIALEKLFVKPAVTKVAKSAETKNLKQENILDHDSSSSAYRSERERVKKAYQLEELTQKQQLSLKATQVMTTPVVSLQAQMPIREALNVLNK